MIASLFIIFFGQASGGSFIGPRRYVATAVPQSRVFTAVISQ